jgi:hypothetical protein
MENGLQTNRTLSLAPAAALPTTHRMQALQNTQGLSGRNVAQGDRFESLQKEKPPAAPKETLWQQVTAAFRPLINAFRAFIGLGALEVDCPVRKQAIVKHELAHALTAYLSGANINGIYLKDSEGLKEHHASADNTHNETHNWISTVKQQAFVSFTTNSVSTVQQQAALYIAGLASGLQPSSLELKPDLLKALPHPKQQAELRQHLLLGADTDMQQLLDLLKKYPNARELTKKEASTLKREGQKLNEAIDEGSAAASYKENAEASLTQLLRTPSLQRLHTQTYRLLNSIPEASWQALASELEADKQLEGHPHIVALFEKHIGKKQLKELKAQWQQM